MSLKKLLRSWRIWILIFCLLVSVVAIQPNPWNKGISIKSVIKDSTANLAGIENPKPNTAPMAMEKITEINGKPINNIVDYSDFIDTLEVNRTFTLKTNKNIYRITTKPLYKTIFLNETEQQNVTKEIFNATTNITENVTETITVNKTLQEYVGMEDVGLRVINAPTTNIRKGLELQGGTRVLLKPEEKISKEDLDTLISNMKERLNVYGLSDIVVRPTTDLNGDVFILVEIAGASDEEVKNLLSKQGKFEAKVGSTVVFKGGDDIKHVCRTADCSGIDSRSGCSPQGSEYFCRFRFSISLSPEAAQRQADATNRLSIEPGAQNSEDSYLNESLDLYLDDEKVDSLRIGSSLKGRAETEISISGSGSGATQQAAINDALQNMKRLQTILITGSLPVKINIVKTDNISPVLGNEFIRNTLLVGLIAMIAVVIIIMLRYRKLIVSIPVIITLLSELVILLGVAAIIGWNLDLVAIAAIIVAIGTGVDDQLIIIDETVGRKTVVMNWKEKLKNAFFIIMASYFTLIVAMVPLLSAGAGLLMGFAITTMLGVSIGVFITRPAFASIVEILIKKD